MISAPEPAEYSPFFADYIREVGTADPTNRILGNRQLTAMHRLGGEPLARYFDCGSAGLSGQVADQARLTIDLYTQLQPVGAGTLVATHATAQAKPINGAGAAFAGCRSTGELEKRIAELVRKHLAGLELPVAGSQFPVRPGSYW